MFYDSFAFMNPMEEYCLITGLHGRLLGEHCLIKGERVISASEGWPAVRENGGGGQEKNGERLWKPDPASLRNILPESDGTIRTEEGRFFVETIGMRRTLILCGLGHVGRQVLILANMLGFETCVLEDRPLVAEGARELGADRILTGSFEENLRMVPEHAGNLYVIMTRGHRYDMECLKIILKRKSTYVGMMCSRKRIAEARRLMAEEGIGEEAFDRLHAPIGLDIGAETPEEIAVSVMAEIVSVMRKTGADSIPKEIMKALSDSRRRVLAQIVSRSGSAPRKAGSRMVIYEDGSFAGTIGGGCIEADIIRRSRELLFEMGGPSLVKVDLSGKNAADTEGASCGGVMEVLLEVLEPGSGSQ